MNTTSSSCGIMQSRFMGLHRGATLVVVFLAPRRRDEPVPLCGRGAAGRALLSRWPPPPPSPSPTDARDDDDESDESDDVENDVRDGGSGSDCDEETGRPLARDTAAGARGTYCEAVGGVGADAFETASDEWRRYASVDSRGDEPLWPVPSLVIAAVIALTSPSAVLPWSVLWRALPFSPVGPSCVCACACTCAWDSASASACACASASGSSGMQP